MGLFTLLKAMPVAFFWSSVMAFIPVSLYLVLKGIAREKDGNDVNLNIVFSIFGICFLFYYVIYIVGYLQGKSSGADAFAILSSISIVSFWLAVIVYLPVAIFQGLRRALHHKTKIVTKISYLTFTVCLLIVSVLYGIHWMKGKTDFGPIDLATAIPIVLLSSALISIIPILIFIILKSPKPDSDHGKKKQRITVMFLTYGGFLLIFSMLYAYNWTKNISVGEAGSLDGVLLLLGLLYVAAIVSFLPMQIYVMMKISMSRTKPQPRVLFIIYCVSFVLLTTIYSFQWLQRKKQGFLGAEKYGEHFSMTDLFSDIKKEHNK